jgi:hypothetical protein
MTNPTNPGDYPMVSATAKAAIQAARTHAVSAVNSELNGLYCDLGRLILDRQTLRGGDEGHRALVQSVICAPDLLAGPDHQSADAWSDESIVQRLLQGHHMLLIDKLDDRPIRLWSAQAAIEYGWRAVRPTSVLMAVTLFSYGGWHAEGGDRRRRRRWGHRREPILKTQNRNPTGVPRLTISGVSVGCCVLLVRRRFAAGAASVCSGTTFAVEPGNTLGRRCVRCALAVAATHQVNSLAFLRSVAGNDGLDDGVVLAAMIDDLEAGHHAAACRIARHQPMAA